MNKILMVTALLATIAVPIVPAYAAPMTMSGPTAAECKMMPLLPGCTAMMKAAHDSMMMAKPAAKMAMATPKMAKPAMAKPMMMPMWPTCVMAPAGSGHMFDCTMPK